MKYLYKIRLSIAVLIFIITVFSFLGYIFSYKIFNLYIINTIKNIQLDVSVFYIDILVLFLLLSLLFGRLYCSLICPIGFLQEIILFFRLKKSNKYLKNNYLKYIFTSILWGSFIGGSVFLLKYFEPSIIFSSVFSLSFFAFVFILLILFGAFFFHRSFCRNICPIGIVLGLISRISLFKIYIEKEHCIDCKRCEQNCPVSCVNVENSYIDNENCIKCLKCINECPVNAMKYSIKYKDNNKKFDINRRKFIISFSALALLATVAKTTNSLVSQINYKIKKFILPPGAVDCDKFIHKCFNCNLCVKSCPSKIIVKSDLEFPVVHIDYERGYCRENCIKCSEVCPAGAIKKITLDEKKKTKIALAKVVSTKCTHCDLCVKACPYGAITKEDLALPVIDNAKCIGCGACKNVCGSETIDLFAMDTQVKI